MKSVFVFLMLLIIQPAHSACTPNGQECPEKMDVVFLLDHSGSITDRNPKNGSWDNWVLVKDFVVQMVKELVISRDNSHVGVATFGNMAITRVELNRFHDTNSITNKILDIPPGNGNTNTYAGLKLMREMFRVENGGRYKVPRVGVIITDGRPTVNPELTVAEATSLFYARVALYAIGVTDDIDTNFLKAISSPPRRLNHNYWLTPDFRSLVNIIRSVHKATCDPVINFNTTCRNMDLVFSTSLPTNKNHLTTLEDLISGVTSLMPVGRGQNGVRIALTTYNYQSSNMVFRLDSYFDKRTIDSQIKSLDVNNGSPYGDPNRALSFIRTDVFVAGHGMREDSSKVIVLFIWDEQLYNQQDFEAEMKLFVEAGVRVIIVDVRGKLGKSYLQSMVAFPRDVLSLSGYTYLNSKINILANTLCSVDEDVGCQYIADIVVLVDVSSRIYQEANYQTLWSTYYQGFLLNFVQAFNIAQTKTRIAIITYNSNPSVIVSLIDSNSLVILENFITTVQPTRDNNVNLASALRTARSTFSASRAGVKKVVLLLNYQYPSIELDRTRLEADFIKGNAEIFTVGIIPPQNKDVSIALLREVASSSANHYHSALDFTHLNDFLADIIKDICIISTVPTTNIIPTTTTTTITTTTATTTTTTTTTATIATTTTTITTTTPKIITAKPLRCNKPVDVLFVIDTTLNVNNNYYTTLYLPMLQSIAMKLELDTGITRVSAIAFAESASIVFDFNSFNTARAVATALTTLPHQGYTTNLQNAISLAYNQAFTASHGARVNDNRVSKVMVIVTSNPSNNAVASIAEAGKARSKGIYIVTVGIGTYLNLHELANVANYPHTSSMLVVDTARKMPSLVEPLTDIICPDHRRLINQCHPGYAGPFCAECRSGSDIVFILPSSYSIDLKTFMMMTSFVGDVIEFLNVDWSNGSRVGIMVAGEIPVVSFDLSKHVTKMELLEACNVEYRMQRTCDSAQALKLAREQMFTVGRGDRAGFNNYVIFLTNGFYDNRTASWLEAVETRKKGISIIMIGIGPYVQRDDLVMMSSDENNVHMLASFTDLLSPSTLISTKLSPMLCNSVDPCSPNPCQNNAICTVVAGNSECGVCPTGYSGRYCDKVCSGPQDVIFLLNAASQTHRERMKYLTTFASELVSLMNVHPSSTRVALVYWGQEARVLFHLNDFGTRKDVIDAISTTPFMGGLSNTASALELVRNEVLTPANGDRPEARNIVILVTNVDAEIDKEQVIQNAIELRTAGTIMMTVGVEFHMLNSNELKAISSFPRPSNQFNVNRFSDLHSIVASVSEGLCDRVNECSSSPCLNGGQCEDGFKTYHCRCATSYVGKRCNSVCHSRIDLSLVLDISGSVVDEYDISIALARRLTYGLDVTSDLVRIASVTFDDLVSSGFNLLRYHGNKKKLLGAFDFSLKQEGKTNIKDALNYVRNSVYLQKNGDRQNVKNVVVLLTDGYANVNDEPPYQGADLLKRQGVEIYVVAIGTDVHLAQLSSLASSPQSRYVVHMPPRSDPLKTADTLLRMLCNQ